MNFAPTLTTHRLHLRQMRLRDGLFFFRLIGNNQVRRYLGGPVPLGKRPGRLRDHLRGWREAAAWLVTTRSAPMSLGLVSLTPHKDGTDYELSYQFHPNSWGQGFAKEACARLLSHAADDLGLLRVIAETQTANTASCHLLQALGMVESRRLERFGAEQAIYTTQP